MLARRAPASAASVSQVTVRYEQLRMIERCALLEHMRVRQWPAEKRHKIVDLL